MGDNLVYAVRGNTGFYVNKGVNKDKTTTLFEDRRNPKEFSVRVFEYSNNGKYIAYCDCEKTVLKEVETGREIFSVDLKRTQAIMFSPRDTYMLTWEPYTVYGAKTETNKAEPNLRVYRVSDGAHLTTVIAQKQSNWKPQFSDDEKIAIRQVGGELLLHKDENLFEKYTHKAGFPKMDNFELAPGANTQYVAVFTPPHGSGTAQVSVRHLDAKFTVANTRNFFNGDRASLIWNCRGTALLIHASVEVDKTNQSYYGASSVHLINVVTGDCCLVPLSKTGPVYAVKWNPNGKEFAVCYGYMPAKVTLYSFRGISVFEMDEGPRNDIHYNAFGNILLVCGFGNLAVGKMEFWDVEKRKEIITIEVPNTTIFEWAPDGRHFLTATTTPRLRIENNIRFWHYSGKLLNEITYNSPVEELWQVKFRPAVFNEFKLEELTKQQRLQAGLLIKTKHVDHPLNNLPAGAIKKAGAYVPPHLRGRTTVGMGGGGGSNGGLQQQPTAIVDEEPVKEDTGPKMSETEKKIKNLQRKADDIKKLKDRKAKGEKMQINQMEKIKKEGEILAELAALKLTA